MGNNVLIIDDHDYIRTIMKTVLATLPFQIIECTNGLEGLALIKSGFHPDLIISDVQMPLMDGLTFLSELLKDPRLRAIPCILTSACPQFERQALALGAVSFLSKLRLYEDLLSIVEKALYSPMDYHQETLGQF